MDIVDGRSYFKTLLENTHLRSTDTSEVRKNTINAFATEVKKITPPKLYRYRSFNEFTIEALMNNIISTSHPAAFSDENDSLVQMDTRAVLELATNHDNINNIIIWLQKNPQLYKKMRKEEKAKIKTLINDKHFNYFKFLKPAKNFFSKLLPQIVVEAKDFLKNYPHIACLTESVTSTKMWTDYADNYKGFALEYPFANYISPCLNCTSKCINEHLELLYPVIYTDTPFDAQSFVLRYFKETYCRNKSIRDFIPIDDELAIYKVLLYKRKTFAFEREWRVISFCQTNPSLIMKPTALYMGPSIDNKNKNLLIDYAVKNHVLLYQMNDDASNYSSFSK